MILGREDLRMVISPTYRIIFDTDRRNSINFDNRDLALLHAKEVNGKNPRMTMDFFEVYGGIGIFVGRYPKIRS